MHFSSKFVSLNAGVVARVVLGVSLVLGLMRQPVFAQQSTPPGNNIDSVASTQAGETPTPTPFSPPPMPMPTAVLTGTTVADVEATATPGAMPTLQPTPTFVLLTLTPAPTDVTPPAGQEPPMPTPHPRRQKFR